MFTLRFLFILCIRIHIYVRINYYQYRLYVSRRTTMLCFIVYMYFGVCRCTYLPTVVFGLAYFWLVGFILSIVCVTNPESSNYYFSSFTQTFDPLLI